MSYEQHPFFAGCHRIASLKPVVDVVHEVRIDEVRVRDGKTVGLFGTRTRTHLCELSEQKWVRILGAERVKLACPRQADGYSPQAKFPL